MIYFLSKIWKWTLTLLTVESSSVVFATYFMWSLVCFVLIQDGGKNCEKAINFRALTVTEGTEYFC